MVVCPACGPPFPSPSAWLTTLRRIASKSVSTGTSDAFGSSLDGGSVCVEYTGFGISREWTSDFDSRRASVPVRSRFCPCSFAYRRNGEIQRVLQWPCPFYDSMFTIDCAWLAIVNRPGRRLFFLRRLCLVPRLCLQVLFAGTRIHRFKTEIAADRLLCHAGLHRARSPLHLSAVHSLHHQQSPCNSFSSNST